MADDAQQRELLQRASRKRLAGQKLNQQEQRAIDRAKREHDEQLRTIHYRTLPKKQWVAWSGRQHKVLAEQAQRYGVPLEGETIDLPRVAKWLHDLLAEHGPRILSGDASEEIWTGDASSPALERLREVQYEIKKRELAELDKVLVSRDAMHKCLTQIVTILRAGGDTFQKQFGPDALDLLNDLIADCDRSVEAFFQQHQAADESRGDAETRSEAEKTTAEPTTKDTKNTKGGKRA
jgi:hypothetical protein